jgi:hypothetical protein
VIPKSILLNSRRRFRLPSPDGDSRAHALRTLLRTIQRRTSFALRGAASCHTFASHCGREDTKGAIKFVGASCSGFIARMAGSPKHLQVVAIVGDGRLWMNQLRRKLAY